MSGRVCAKMCSHMSTHMSTHHLSKASAFMFVDLPNPLNTRLRRCRQLRFHHRPSRSGHVYQLWHISYGILLWFGRHGPDMYISYGILVMAYWLWFGRHGPDMYISYGMLVMAYWLWFGRHGPDMCMDLSIGMRADVRQACAMPRSEFVRIMSAMMIRAPICVHAITL